MRSFRCLACTIIALSLLPMALSAQPGSGDDKQTTFTIADGEIQFSATSNWKKVKPRSNMLDAEFVVPKSKGDETDGRLTIMGAGGSVQANIDRWIGQFKTADGDPATDFKLTESTIAGQKVHTIDIKGTFADSMGGPFGPKTQRENYRMLAAVIETANVGKYFVKLYGPEKTIKANAETFKSFVQSMELLKATTTQKSKPTVFQVNNGGIEFTATGDWEKVAPRSSMLAAEFRIPKSEGDKKDGRLTIMNAGGSVEANIERWIGQFQDADGNPLEGVEATSSTAAGHKVHTIDLSGTFGDSMGGPVSPKTDRENYRMFGSIIELETSDGSCFVKMYGPAKTMAANAQAFKALVQSMKIID